MIIVIKPGAPQKEIDRLTKKLEALGLSIHLSQGKERTILGVIGDGSVLGEQAIDSIPCVEQVVRIMKPYKLVGRDFHPDDTEVEVKGETFGGRKIQLIAGPCAVESRAMIVEAAAALSKEGVGFLRGGAFKPRTSPYSFQGLGEEGLRFMREASEGTGIRIVSELMDPRDTELVCKYVDVIQIGARNMQNFRLLTEVGDTDKPVLLKRGMSATVVDLLMSAEYILSRGNRNILLCERGIRTFENSTRNTLDLSAVPLLKNLSHLPVIVDPSHGVGRWDLVEPMARAAVAAGADGLLIEVHPRPEEALSDGSQSLKPQRFTRLIEELRTIAGAVGRTI